MKTTGLVGQNFKKTDDVKIRLCHECQQKVYKCYSCEDIELHTSKGHCIAVKELNLVGTTAYQYDESPEE